MNTSIEYLLNKASAAHIAEHLTCCDTCFVPSLSSRVDINDYAQKIASKAERFEAWSGGILVGLVAVYCNDQENRIAHITSASVLRAWTNKGIAMNLIARCVEHAKAAGAKRMNLEVACDNMHAIALYEKSGFVAGKTNGSFITMGICFTN